MATKYKFHSYTSDFQQKDAQVIGSRIAKIAGSLDQARSHPEVLVEDGRHPDSPLRKYFEWDDKKAGEAYRISQAKKLLSYLYVVEPRTRETPKVEVTVPAPVKTPPKSVKLPLPGKTVTEMACADLESWLLDYGKFEYLKPAAQHVKRALAALGKAR